MKGRKRSPVTSRIRNATNAILLLCCLVTVTSALDLPPGSVNVSLPSVVVATRLNSPQHYTGLRFPERVAYQRAIEEVYRQHRIWPKENAKPKPLLDAVMSAQQVEKKVEGYLRESQALEVYSQSPIAPEQLQAEMERMAGDTKQPEVLRELFEALGNDPFVIAECLARPVLTERLVAELSAHDNGQYVALLRTQAASSEFNITTLGRAAYTFPEIDPCTDDNWSPTRLSNAPDAREGHTAVWTGSEMIVWGGYNSSGAPNTGGRYNPSTDSWTATSTISAPDGRGEHTAVWTGSQMVVWGGENGGSVFLNTGGRYNPGTDSWTATSTTNAPQRRALHTAVWTGTEMIVWGGTQGYPNYHYFNTGGRYNPSTDSWTGTNITGAPAARWGHTAVWTGSQMVVWGGLNFSSYPNTGGRYNPITNSWTATSTANAPEGREYYTAVWTGSQMIVWGGAGSLNTGGRYSPSADSWTATSTTNAPEGRGMHTAVWTGSEMIVWGGVYCTIDCDSLNTGGRYSPGTDSWRATSTANAPTGRGLATAVWASSQMIVWGGYDSSGELNTGGRYCATGPPVVTTNPATLIASFSATLNGSVDPQGLTTTVYFQYGTTTSYGHTTANQTETGNTYQNVTANISGLTASTTYHFRIVATNTAGTRYGSDRTFTTLRATGPPVVITNAATLIASFSATLNSSVDPHGLTTTVYFQYGTTTSYGLTTAPQSQSGGTYRNITANISSLTASTVYHFRTVATNNAGTRYGSDRTLTTLTANGPPVVSTSAATNVTSSSATLSGSLDPHGLTTSVYFQYGTTASYGSTTPIQSQNGNTYRDITANISGLSTDTAYHFRIVATNSGGTRNGVDRTFTTP